MKVRKYLISPSSHDLMQPFELESELIEDFNSMNLLELLSKSPKTLDGDAG